ncbi:MAG: iron-containing alcohol dehydrogenase [Leptolyngbyaceae bacterium]|nr:iron-containing alcohol dehydrogenase [Leptolyngbyaceae bacterium]
MIPFSFARIPTLHFGPGKVGLLPELIVQKGCRRVLLVTGARSLQASGHLDRILAMLTQNGIHVDPIVCAGEPSTQWVDDNCNTYRDCQIEAVVAIGGGSVIDGGKALSAMLPHQNSIFDHLEGVGKGLPHSGVKLPFIAIPTTSGTGSEVTKNAVISEVGDAGYKKSLRHENLVPDVVLVDGELLVSCPPDVTAACGLDAFTQLVEPYLSPTATSLTDALAWSGLEAFNTYFLAACDGGAADPHVREGMAYAALMSGIALANAGLGIVHGLASPLGGYFPIPHGVACSALVAESLKVNWKALKERAPDSPAIAKLVRLGRLLSGTDGHTDDWYGQACGELIDQWADQLRIPRLGSYGLQTTHFSKVLDGTHNRNNPIPLTREEIYSILHSRL